MREYLQFNLPTRTSYGISNPRFREMNLAAIYFGIQFLKIEKFPFREGLFFRRFPWEYLSRLRLDSFRIQILRSKFSQILVDFLIGYLDRFEPNVF